MFNCKLRPTGFALVLIFGLTSCAPDGKKVKDVYISPPPKLVISGKGQDLKAFDQSAQKTMDLGDAIDMRESHAAVVTLISRCRRGSRDSIKTVRSTVEAPLKLFQVVPHELVAADLKSQAASCTFEVQLANSVGSRHIFTIGPVTIGELIPPPAELSLERAGNPLAAETSLRFPDLESVRIRAQTNGVSRLICEDWESKDVNLEQTMLLGAFDTHRMEKRQGTNGQPIERCRIARITNNLITHISAPLLIYFSRPFQVTPIELHRREYGWDPAAVEAVRAEVEMPSGTYLVTNNEDYERIVRIAKKPLRSHSMLVLANASRKDWPTNSFSFTRLTVASGPGSSVTETPEYFEAKINPHGSFQVIAKYRNQARIPNCGKGELAGVFVAFPEPVLLREMNQKAEEIDQQPFSLGAPMVFTGNGPRALFENLKFNDNPTCVWNG